MFVLASAPKYTKIYIFLSGIPNHKTKLGTSLIFSTLQYMLEWNKQIIDVTYDLGSVAVSERKSAEIRESLALYFKGLIVTSMVLNILSAPKSRDMYH